MITIDESLKKPIANFERFDIEIPIELVETVPRHGMCDDAIETLCTTEPMSSYLALLNPQEIKDELSEYGAWNETELSDHNQNLRRILWIAIGNIQEETLLKG